MAMMEETIERSSMAVKAALSPSSLPQWSTGRVEVSKVPARS
jgi:DNA-binding transcriptional regulator YdaS (Cro superfamily)